MADPQRAQGGRRRSATTLAVLLSWLVLGTACSTTGNGRQPPVAAGPATSAAPATAAPASAASQRPPATSPRLAPSEPTRIEIPAIGVKAPIGKVGLNPDGTVEVPLLERADDTGWYRHGPTPGELGPAVILGHVDSKNRPAVFYRLKQLKTGDTIRILRTDTSTAIFTITTVEEVPKTQFPTERVYGDLYHAALRLVTCGGTFDTSRNSYSNNVIAFATFTGTA